MEERPGPGEELNDGAPSVPRLAASTIVLRGGRDALEVLLVRRNPAQRFMGGAWVFPGGALDREDGEGEPALKITAARETREEASVHVPSGELVPYSRWITPKQVKIRFDTWFYLAEAPPDAEPEVDGQECVDWRWATPQDALAAARAGEIEMVFPTRKHLEQLSGFASAHELLAFARTRHVEPIEPRVVVEGETARILLPGETGYEQAE